MTGARSRTKRRTGVPLGAAWGEDAGEDILVSATFEKKAPISSHARRCDASAQSCRRTHPIIPAPTGPSAISRTCSAWRSPTTRTRAAGHAIRRGKIRSTHCAKTSRRRDGAASRRRQTIPTNFSTPRRGVYEIPVGPVHAGIIEPGHFRFQAVGETVLNLEEHLGYAHKGIEKIAEGRDVEGLARLAGRAVGRLHRDPRLGRVHGDGTRCRRRCPGARSGCAPSWPSANVSPITWATSARS